MGLSNINQRGISPGKTFGFLGATKTYLRSLAAQGVAAPDYGTQLQWDNFLRSLNPAPLSNSLIAPRNLAAYYDAANVGSLTVDSANRVKLWSDLSGNSAVNALCLNGVVGNNAQAPNAAPLQVTTGLRITARASLASWNTTNQYFVSKRITTTAEYAFRLDSALAGRLNLFWYSAGVLGSATSTAVVPFSSLSDGYVRATKSASAAGNITVKFYTSSDGVVWTQLGTDVVVVSLDPSSTTNALSIGAEGVGANTATANIYRVTIENGYDGAGSVVFDANFTAQVKLATSFTESSSNAATVTINTSGDTGARICGARDLYQGTVSKQPVYLPWVGSNYAYQRGSGADNLTSSDSGVLDITADIDLQAQAALIDWTPVTVNSLVAKAESASARSYYLEIGVTGSISLTLSQDGTATSTAGSSIAVPFADGAVGWVRATWRASDGRAQFFTSTDGDNWVQLGTNQTIALASIFVSTSKLELGGRLNGTTAFLTGKLYRARIYNGINGTLAFDFNPAAYVSGTTLLDQSVNAATITINGGATIVTRTCVYGDGVDDYMKAAAFVLSQPETVYFTGQQVSWTSLDRLFDGNSASEVVTIRQVTSSPRVALNASSADAPTTDSFIIQTGAVLASVFNGASSAVRVNRAAAVTGSPGTSNANGLTLFSSSAGSVNANATVSELALYAEGSTPTTFAQILNYLSAKWRISI